MKINKKMTILTTSLVTSILLGAAMATVTLAAPPVGYNIEIAQYILNHLSYDDHMNILCYLWGPVLKGDEITTTKGSIYTTPSDGFVMYIDLYPTANLFHPVQYVFLAEPTKDISVFDEKYPPSNFDNYHLVENSFARFFYSIENRRAPIPEKTTPPLSTTSLDSRWAVLMNGGYNQGNNHVRYWNDLSNIYITLNHVYEIPDENIIVLCSDGLNPAPDQSNGLNSNPDLDGDGDNDIMYSCILSNVNLVFDGLADNFTGTEKLFIFTTDHGDTLGGLNTVQNLWNQEILTDAHFAELLNAIPAAEKICTFEPCFSGGFLDNVVVPPGPIVASSACRYDEYSWAMPPDYVYDEYVFHWTAAIKGEDAYGNPVDADTNQDGIVSMEEAFIYAEDHDTASEEPQYGEYPNETGSYLSLWITSAPPEQPTIPLGPTLCVWHVEYTYTSHTTEPDNEQIYYQFDWDDGNYSEWLGPYNSGQTASGTHSWTELGKYNVTVRAKDIWGAASKTSEPLTVTITDNTPPEPPQFTGKTEGKPGKPYLFNILTNDSQNQEVSYYIDWGDNTTSDWFGPYLPGVEIHVTHTWAKKGTYLVKAKAKDTMNAESDWSTLQVVMPTEYKISLFSFLQYLMEKYPHVFPLLRQLL